MKKLSLALVGAVLTAAAGTAHAGTVMVRYTPFQTGIGGEFRIEHQSGNAGVHGTYSDITGTVSGNNLVDTGKVLSDTSGDFYTAFSRGANAAQISASNAARGIADFQTFCIERSEHVSNNTSYHFSIDTHAYGGGMGKGGYAGTGDPLGHHAAFLYESFRRGTLAGYNTWGNSVSEAMRESSAKTLQHVLWYFENELGGANTNQATFTVALANLWASNPNSLNASQQAQAAAWATAAINAVNGGWINRNVRVLNLWTYNAQGQMELAQSQLTLIPLPSGAGLAMAGLGLLAIRRRTTR
jgi:hypothetical protein